MHHTIFLLCFLVCAFFLLLTYKKVWLKGKSFLLPSTFCAMAWGLSSIGVFLISNRYVISQDSEYFSTEQTLDKVGAYLFNILLVVFSACLFARYKSKRLVFDNPLKYVDLEIPLILEKLKIFLYFYFVLGLLRLLSILWITGFDYAVMREYYLLSSRTFGLYDLWLIRICSYLRVLTVFYICLMGYKMAISGIDMKKVLRTFLLFCPFQLSFGGRLFILSFFLPFFFSFFSISVLAKLPKRMKKKAYRKITYLIAIPVFLVMAVQSLKFGDSLQDATNYAYEVFYMSTSFIHMNELWKAIPAHFDLGYGMNMLGFTCEPYASILTDWKDNNNSALVCVPSIIPQLYFDFGETLSYFFYFVVFYLLEKHAMWLMSELSLSHFLVFVEYCIISFETATSSAFDTLRTLCVAVIFISIFNRYLKVNHLILSEPYQRKHSFWWKVRRLFG